MKLTAVVALVALIAGLLAGYEWRDTLAAAEKTAAIEFAFKQAKKNADITLAEEMALFKSQQKTKIVFRSIIKEAPKHVPDNQKNNSNCNVSVGTVRLYNRAATERMPEAASIDADGNTKPSAVTEGRLIHYGLSVIDQYNRAKNQCNALIRWHKKTTKINSDKDT